MDHSATTDRFQLVLIPGLGADVRQWEPQKEAFPNLLTPPWIPPLRRETLPGYAARLAETVPRERPLILGGSSFGGMLACEMARHLQPSAVILIGSCRSPQALHAWVRLLRPLLLRVPALGIAFVKPLAPAAVRMFRRLTTQQKRQCAAAFRGTDCRFMSWAIRAILGWRPGPIGDTPVFHIHGRRDLMIRAARVAADVIVPDGGHLINLSHAEQVNAFIRNVCRTVG